ncbi:MAG: hypothetical protein AB8G15_10195, partial [Saprospiraceae bacterium]
MKKLILIFTLFFILNTYCRCYSQDSALSISKLELSSEMNLYYRNLEEHVVEKSHDSTKTILYNFKMKNTRFYSFPHNDNFIIFDDFILSLNIKKDCLTCRDEKEFFLTPWIVRVECRSLKIKETQTSKLPYIASINALNVENKKSILYSNNQIHFDFLHYKEKILLLLLADNMLYVYENVGEINNNQWKLLKAFPSLLQTPFRGYVDRSDKISILFDRENIFSINFEYDYLKRIRKTIDTNQCLFYNHKSKRYSWISQQEANGL